MDRLDAMDCCQQFCSLVGMVVMLAIRIFSNEHGGTSVRLGTESNANTRSSVWFAIIQTGPISVDDSVAMTCNWAALTAGESGVRARSAAQEIVAAAGAVPDQLARCTL